MESTLAYTVLADIASTPTPLSQDWGVFFRLGKADTMSAIPSGFIPIKYFSKSPCIAIEKDYTMSIVTRNITRKNLIA